MHRQSRVCRLLFALALLQPLSVAAQGGEERIEVKDLRTPYSPAFVLLGVEPTSVEQPTNPKALAVSVFSALENGGNLALEIAPYWLAPHPDLTFSDFYEAGLAETIVQTLAVSVATALNLDKGATGDSDESTGNDETGAGVALRFSLLRGKPAAEDVRELHALDEKLLDLFERFIDAKKRGSESEMRSIQQAIDEKVDEGEPLRKRIGESGHLGFSCDVAAGVAGKFPSGRAGDGRFSRAGVWITPAYRVADVLGAKVDIIGTGRYLRDEEGENEDLGDVGGRIAIDFADILFSSDLSLSFEGLRRFGLSKGDSGDTERLAGIIEYELPEVVQLGDAKYLTATFGQDFDEGGDDDRLIVLFGLNFSFGSNPSVKFE